MKIYLMHGVFLKRKMSGLLEHSKKILEYTSIFFSKNLIEKFSMKNLHYLFKEETKKRVFQ